MCKRIYGLFVGVDRGFVEGSVLEGSGDGSGGQGRVEWLVDDIRWQICLSSMQLNYLAECLCCSESLSEVLIEELLMLRTAMRRYLLGSNQTNPSTQLSLPLHCSQTSDYYLGNG